MKRFIHLLLAMLVFTISATAQMLECVAVDTNVNTYLTGINNKNFVTGYYEQLGIETGFIINAKGKRITIDGSMVGFANARVESINDHNVAVVVGATGTNTGIFKCYLTTAGEIGSIVQVTNVQQPNALPLDINNNNDISGWYQGSQKYLFVKHDSIVPGSNNAWEARRYFDPGPVYFNTTGGGINDANTTVGWYVDGANVNCYTYDNIVHSFHVLNNSFKIKLWDINNNGRVVGELKQTNGTYMAFWGTPGTTNFSSINSLSSIFMVNTIQSVANGINDNDVIVGSFLDPITSTWKGFIYHMNVDEYRIPGFDFAQNAWKMRNHYSGTNPVWTTGYWQGTDYINNDPYANNGVPLMDPILATTHHITTIQPQRDPTWKAFATEFDKNQAGLSSNPDEQDYYKNILKPKMFDRWYPFSTTTFSGLCYGFTYSSLLHLFYDNLFSSWYGIPAGTNISQVGNTDYTSIFAIERCLVKQMDKKFMQTMVYTYFWQQLYRLRNTFSESAATSDPTGMSFRTSQTSNVRHSVLPYKIRTPRTLPFLEPDTIWVYDSNYPDSNQFITIDNQYLEPDLTGISSTAYPGFNAIMLADAGVRLMATQQYSQLKTTSVSNYSEDMIVGLFRNGEYTISSNGSTVAQYASGNYSNDSSIIPIQRYDIDQPAFEHLVDTNKTLNITTTNYLDSAMVWTQVNESRSMGISRGALPGETDHSTQKNAMITYGNPDNFTKYLAAFMREDANDMQQGVNIIVSNICADPGDSIVTRSPSTFVYNVTKVNGTASCTYTLDIFAAYNGAINEFHSGATIEPNSSHTIDPYFNNGNGDQIAVIVDNGMDGITDDTLFVAGFPVGMHSVIHQAGIKVYPNPVYDDLSIEFAIAGTYNILVTDVIGKTVYSNSIVVTTGKVNIPMGQHVPGVYLIQVSDSKGNQVFRDKVIKQ